MEDVQSRANVRARAQSSAAGDAHAQTTQQARLPSSGASRCRHVSLPCANSIAGNHPTWRRKIPRAIAENRRLLLPVMILLRSWFVRRFRAVTGEIFFARNVSPRAGNAVSPGRALQHHARDIPSRLHRPLKSEARSGRFAGPNAGESAGRESPVPPDQAIDSARDFGAKIFSQKNPPVGVPGDIPRWRN